MDVIYGGINATYIINPHICYTTFIYAKHSIGYTTYPPDTVDLIWLNCNKSLT